MYEGRRVGRYEGRSAWEWRTPSSPIVNPQSALGNLLTDVKPERTSSRHGRQADTDVKPTRTSSRHGRQADTDVKPTRTSSRHGRQADTDVKPTRTSSRHGRQADTDVKPTRTSSRHGRQADTDVEPGRTSSRHGRRAGTDVEPGRTSSRDGRRADSDVFAALDFLSSPSSPTSFLLPLPHTPTPPHSPSPLRGAETRLQRLGTAATLPGIPGSAVDQCAPDVLLSGGQTVALPIITLHTRPSRPS